MLACPDCATSRLVRASALDEQFWWTVAVLVLPLLVLALIGAALYRFDAPGTARRK